MSIVFLKSGSKGCDGKEQNDKRGMVRIMCNMSDAQVHVKARRPLVYAKYIIFHAPDWCVQQNIL